MSRIKEIQLEEARIQYRDRGQGSAVVLLHGYLESGKIWEGFYEELAGHYRVIVPDLPGHGGSSMGGSVYTMDRLAGVLADFLHELGIAKAVVVGHSLGGYIALALADLFPSLLRAYVLFHSSPFADSEDKKLQRERECELIKIGRLGQILAINIPRAFADDNLEHLSNEVKRARAIARESPLEGTIALLQGMKCRPDRTAIVQKEQPPLMLIGGMKDNYIPVEIFERMAELAPHARVESLVDSGHMGFIEERDRALEVLDSFMSTL